MAIRLITTIKRFQGMSSDTKPEKPPDGSTFHVIDTGEEYVFHDGTWEKDWRMIESLRSA